MDTRTGRIYEYQTNTMLIDALDKDPNLTKLSRSERRKLERVEQAARPAELRFIRGIAKERNKAKAARKARRKNRGK